MLKSVLPDLTVMCAVSKHKNLRTYFFIVSSCILISSKPFIYQQMHFISVLENRKIYVKSYQNCSYMFRSTTIIRELTYVSSLILRCDILVVY
jgi:hypothetical protein